MNIKAVTRVHTYIVNIHDLIGAVFLVLVLGGHDELMTGFDWDLKEGQQPNRNVRYMTNIGVILHQARPDLWSFLWKG
jgi:hypothetical protein